MGSLIVGTVALLRVLFSNDPERVADRKETEAYFTKKNDNFTASCDAFVDGYNNPRPKVEVVKGPSIAKSFAERNPFIFGLLAVILLYLLFAPLFR
jgi:hypothetical protein